MIKILLIEDDPFIREMYIAKIEQEKDYKVIEANNGELGLQKTEEENPNLILLDVVLPKMDGFSVLKQLKQNQKTKDIPVIILSNLGHKSDIDKGFSLGAKEYIIKSHFTPSEILKKIKEILNN